MIMIAPRQQRLRLLQVSGVKALGEPTVDRRQQLAGLVPLALALPQPTQTHRGPKLPGLGLLAAGDVEGLMKVGFRLCVMLRESTPARPSNDHLPSHPRGLWGMAVQSERAGGLFVPPGGECPAIFLFDLIRQRIELLGVSPHLVQRCFLGVRISGARGGQIGLVRLV